MKFYKDQLFHIYNQGNNRQQVFFSDENYKYFLWKMRSYLPPFGDLIAYVLMPNHFHWQLAAKLVLKITDWEYSSAKDYAGLRKGNLYNLELGRKYVDYY